MKNNKSTKVLIIVALMVGILSVSLGFAAFSATLTISSSATVTPDDDEFDIVVYGVDEAKADFDYMEPSFYSSLTSSVGFVDDSEIVNATMANISSLNNGKQINISNLSAEFSEVGESVYYFMIKNEGSYDAYLNFSEYIKYFTEGFQKTCIPQTGTSANLVEEACKKVGISFVLYNSAGESLVYMDGFDVSKAYKFAKNEFLIFKISIYYFGYPSDVLADGPFDVGFDDLQFTFRSAPVGEIINP